ncbi:MAG: pyruvate, phosphate dikinase/phosphoenolpyruvate synthase regulator [Proteobacteria bacterium]|nr:pyruvate, phosphate dikinase/phosphoenolpyruvate synthase regulator [Pseudomonadota bacterium]
MDNTRKLAVHLISDSTGETVAAVARATLVQFADVETEEHTYPFTTHSDQVAPILERITASPGVVFFTIVEKDLRQSLVFALQEHSLPYVDVLGPGMQVLSGTLNLAATGRPGLQHSLDANYFSRIDAMQYTLAHDDGQSLRNLAQADIILVGVSRTSKTPTSMYLANRGYRVANVPLVPNIPPPDLDSLERPVVVALTVDPERLAEIRRHRLREFSTGAQNEYIDYEAVHEEVRQIERYIRERGWPMLDVTRRSIEETAAAVLDIARKRGLKRHVS